MNILNGIPEKGLLTPAEENALAREGSAASQEKLVMHALQESFFYAKGCFQSRGLDDGEILSACFTALTKAVRRFRPNELRFFGYAKADIRGEMSRAKKALSVVKKVQNIEALPAEPEDEDDSGVELPTPTRTPSEPPSELPDFEGICLREEWNKVAPFLHSELNDKERLVLELNFKGGLSIKQIGALLDFTRSEIDRTKQSALKKVREKLGTRKKFYGHSRD